MTLSLQVLRTVAPRSSIFYRRTWISILSHLLPSPASPLLTLSRICFPSPSVVVRSPASEILALSQGLKAPLLPLSIQILVRSFVVVQRSYWIVVLIVQSPISASRAKLLKRICLCYEIWPGLGHFKKTRNPIPLYFNTCSAKKSNLSMGLGPLQIHYSVSLHSLLPLFQSNFHQQLSSKLFWLLGSMFSFPSPAIDLFFPFAQDSITNLITIISTEVTRYWFRLIQVHFNKHAFHFFYWENWEYSC